ncbi:beta strand repeat-containing protein [Sphingomonas sp. LT1P40]|uniref:beta strand repeat-containing protein n=1 Tax=Alteristakelama amylovorans TaxID=3096166 RepID=UPI002FC6CA98
MAIIDGTNNGETLNGTPDADTINAGGGDDTVLGGTGDDTINGGDGNDTLYGQQGADTYYAGEGNDRIGEAGGDTIYGEGGDDIVDTHVTAGNSVIDLGTGNDQAIIGIFGTQFTQGMATIIGGEGNDLVAVYHGTGNVVDLGTGSDQFILIGGSSTVTLGDGADEILLGIDSPSTLSFPYYHARLTLTDYTPGVDRISGAWKGGWLINWDGRTNPFATGHLTLVQDGADAVLRRDFDAGAGSVYGTVEFIRFKNTNVSALGANDLGGFAPDGSQPATAVLASTGNSGGVPLYEGTVGGDIITGTSGRDYVSSRAGDDVIDTGGGDDIIYTGGGNDTVHAGAGDDFVQSEGGNSIVYGEGGNDTLRGSLYFPGHLVLDGGDGNDEFSVFPDTYFGPNNGQGSPPGTSFEIIGGAGNDTVGFNDLAPRGAIVDLGADNDKMALYTDHQIALTTGSGVDEITLQFYRHIGATAGLAATVSDFELGVDKVILPQKNDFSQYFTGWNGVSNPFTGGFARLLQDGNDTLLQFDKDGGGNNWGTVLRFTGLAATAFVAADFSGWAPVIGTADDTVTGTAGADTYSTGEGNDTLDLSQGGDDTADGGTGNDSFFFGGALTAADRVTGGDGTNDQIGLQGNYSGGLTLGATTISGIELIGLLAGAGNGYSITTVDANVAAARVLTIFGTNLALGNNFTFNGAAETDGQFRIYGGAGTDNLTGGAGSDGIWFGPGRFDPAVDRVNGGGGIDQLALDGDYTITLDGTAIQGIEQITLMAGPAGDRNVFDITVANSLVAAGVQQTIWGLPVTTSIRIDASAELDGSVRVFGGQSHDTIYGSAGDDRLFGGAGSDFLYGGAGNDTYVYDAVSQSTGINADGIHLTAGDKIDFYFTVAGIATTVVGGQLGGDFDIDLAAAIGAGQMGVGEAVLFRPDSGIYAGQSFLVVDANGVAGYQAGQDYVISLLGGVTDLPPDPFV